MIRSLLLVGAGGAFLLYAISLLIGMYFGLRAAAHLRPDRPYRRLNRYSLAWFRDQLSPVGLQYRARAMRFARIMWASLAAIIVFGMLFSVSS
jgi:hypothetical protein